MVYVSEKHVSGPEATSTVKIARSATCVVILDVTSKRHNVPYIESG